MSDEEYYEEEEVTSNTSKKGDGNFLKARQEAKKGELDEQLKEYINEWRKQRSKEEEELKRLKEKQAKRKEIRAEQEKKLAQQKKEEEERLRKEEADKKAKEAEEKRKRLEEAEKKRQAMMQAQKEKQQAAGQGAKGTVKKADSGMGNVQDARREMTKTKEQLEEEKKISLSIRIKPLDLDAMDHEQLSGKASELWETIVRLETEKYDLEERQKRQDYDLKELKERQKQQLRQKAMKKGLDPEALTGKYPPKIRMYSKYERRTDTRSYDDRKKLYEGGWEVVRSEHLEASWKEKYDEFSKRPAKKLPKWFGERPGKKKGDPETPEGEEDVEAAPADEEYDEEEEDEEEYDEEEE